LYLEEVPRLDVFAGNVCAICGKPLRGRAGGIPLYVCSGCWSEWQGAIFGRAPWYLYLRSRERERRKARHRRFEAGWKPPASLDRLMTAPEGNNINL
jgi:hypothetical protein